MILSDDMLTYFGIALISHEGALPALHAFKASQSFSGVVLAPDITG